MASTDATGEAKRHIIGLATARAWSSPARTWPARLIGLAVGSPR